MLVDSPAVFIRLRVVFVSDKVRTLRVLGLFEKRVAVLLLHVESLFAVNETENESSAL